MTYCVLLLLVDEKNDFVAVIRPGLEVGEIYANVIFSLRNEYTRVTRDAVCTSSSHSRYVGWQCLLAMLPGYIVGRSIGLVSCMPLCTNEYEPLARPYCAFQTEKIIPPRWIRYSGPRPHSTNNLFVVPIQLFKPNYGRYGLFSCTVVFRRVEACKRIGRTRWHSRTRSIGPCSYVG